MFVKNKNHFSQVFEEQAKNYGPVFTLWIGNEPWIIISNIDIGRQVFHTKEFSGRVKDFLGLILSFSIEASFSLKPN